MALNVLSLASLASLAYHVEGHGYLSLPTSRRLDEKRSSYTGITAFGGGQHITNCGKDGLSTPSSQDVVTDLQRGSIMKFDIAIDAHHAGHLEMRLCPFIIDGDDQDLSSCTLLQRATADEAGVNDCTAADDRDICASIDPSNPAWWYLAPKGPRGNTHSMWFHIPSNVNCPNDRCTVQFTWKTANSCNPHPEAYCNYYHNVVGPQNTWCDNWYCGSFCDHNSKAADNCEATMGDRLCCSEVFTNCAEIKLVGEGGSSPSHSSTTAAPGSSTAAPSTTASTAAPTTAAPSGGQGSCLRNTDCAANNWCADASYDAWCAAQTTCPSPQCTRGTGGQDVPASPEPESEPEPEPEPEQTEVPTSNPAMTCIATPGLNRGVTDAACAKCADGYQWWPCNDDSLCQCSGSALVQVDPQKLPIKRAIRSKRRGAFLAPDHAMVQVAQ
jgi:hypothetical protein